MAEGHLERAIQVLIADVKGKLREVNYTLGQHSTGELDLSPEQKAGYNAEAIAYASVLDLIDTMMRENGIHIQLTLGLLGTGDTKVKRRAPRGGF